MIALEVCDVNEFMCTDETCIPDEYRCDGTFADCPGGENELNCGLYLLITLSHCLNKYIIKSDFVRNIVFI